MIKAFVVLTPSGLALARRYRDARPEGVAIFAPAAILGAIEENPGPIAGTFATAEVGEFAWPGPLRALVPGLWGRAEAIVAVMALGIVVRLVGPLATDKRRDPAVVVVDDAGRFAIAALGGHASGANDLAAEVAAILGARAVVTTASDSAGLPAVDQVGRSEGWVIERAENLTRVAAAVVRRQSVAVYQDAGSPDWWRPFGPWPEHFRRVASWDAIRRSDPLAILAISDRALPLDLPTDRIVAYRPPSLVAGIGCRRGTPRSTIEAWVAEVFLRHGLAEQSLFTLATVMLKIDEPGLLEFAGMRNLPLVAFPAEHIAAQPGTERPSERVFAKTGLYGVAEPSALRAAGAASLLVPKQKGPGITLALARRPGQSADPASYCE